MHVLSKQKKRFSWRAQIGHSHFIMWVVSQVVPSTCKINSKEGKIKKMKEIREKYPHAVSISICHYIVFTLTYYLKKKSSMFT